MSHLNLHKTFCIPHGGGGPGVGPVAVREHLAPYLPSHPLRPEAGPVGRGHADGGVGPVSGAPWGSAGILPIPWAYIRMMGPDGLLRATQTAILSANYVAARLRDHYPVLYSGANGLVAHECILDVRPITAQTGVTVDDIAKRLIDYGFHAPTMSFPVAGTLMVEPTESENLVRARPLLRRDDRDQVRDRRGRRAARGRSRTARCRNAPHTADCVIGPWEHPYPARLAAFPVEGLRQDKYWPPVRRIDGAFGDRNLVCSCPRPEELAAHVIAVFDIDGVLADADASAAPRGGAAEGLGRVLRRRRRRRRPRGRSGAARASWRSTTRWSCSPAARRAPGRTPRRGWPGTESRCSRLVLRRDRDFRPAAQLKADLIAGIGGPEEVAVVVDDDESVTARLGASGYTTELFR